MPTEIDDEAFERGKGVLLRTAEAIAFWNAVQRARDVEADVISAAKCKARRKALGDEE